MMPSKLLLGTRFAAEQGHAEAQESLGALYLVGVGVQKDYVEAAAWFRKAAEQGHAGAALLLGERYDLGEGVPHDAVEAVTWYRPRRRAGRLLSAAQPRADVFQR